MGVRYLYQTVSHNSKVNYNKL